MEWDWNKYMKDHHIKIYTVEELKRKKQNEAILKVCRHAIPFLKKHKDAIIERLAAGHASET